MGHHSLFLNPSLALPDRYPTHSHGGSTVSQYLRQEFHGLIESVNKTHIPELYAWIHELGGYFKRYKGGSLAPWIHNPDNKNASYDLVTRLTQSFFEVWHSRRAASLFN
jgi:hypothetical protein